MNRLFEVLDKIKNKVEKEERPPNPKEALERELHKLYLCISLEICKQKLQGSVGKEVLDKVKEIKQYFKHIENIRGKDRNDPVQK